MAAAISFARSSREIQRLLAEAEQASRTGAGDAAVGAWRAVLAHPCAHYQIITEEILDEVFQVYRQAGRWDEAIEAKRAAIAAGWRTTPDAEADIADVLLLAGRRQSQLKSSVPGLLGIIAGSSRAG